MEFRRAGGGFAERKEGAGVMHPEMNGFGAEKNDAGEEKSGCFFVKKALLRGGN